MAGPFHLGLSSREKFSDELTVQILGSVYRGLPYFSLTVRPPTQYLLVLRISELLTSNLKSGFS